MVGLQYHFTLFPRAPGTPGDLGIKLRKAFSGAEVSGEERTVDIQQGNQRDIREMVPFRQHLRADKNTRASAMYFRQVLLERAFTAGGIPVDTRQRHPRKKRGKRLLQLFCTQSNRHQMG